MKLLFAVFLLLLTWPGVAQRCPVAIDQPRARTFAQWIDSKPLMKSMGIQSGTMIKIPVVFHIILNESQMAGFDPAQITRQLQILNADYQRLNTDTVQTPAEFAKVAGKLNIQFVLASVDPAGQPTSGVEEILTSRDGFFMDINYGTEYKLLSSWPHDQYLNIWVINDHSGNIGYSSFPDFNLPGIPPAWDPRLDGVAIDVSAFGLTSGLYDKGRTLTHEIGHYLGLIHIFGDESGCSSTDYIDDTPPQDKRTRYCPPTSTVAGTLGINRMYKIFVPPVSCIPGINKMYQNYMDYTPDQCMNLFTSLQAERMMKVLQYARTGLLNNPATAPIQNRPPIARINAPDLVTGLEPTAQASFSIYQNGSTVVIDLAPPLSDAEVVIYSIAGQVVFASTGSQRVEMSAYARGVYVVAILSGGEKHVRRVLN